ncbi:MAG TPA: polysaccharide biosynthesis/export family protein [Bryobacteraceae bacterium]|jgi:polysaccharide export outer membrane protein
MFTSRFVSLSICLMGLAAVSFGEDQFTERNPPYRLQSGDTIEVQYRYTPEFNGTASVQPGGFINLALIGDLQVQGMTVAEAQSAIVEKATVRLNHPEVTVLLKDYVHPYFVVAGEVGHPGRFEMHGDVTAMEAVAISGGFKDSSKHSQVVLVRKYNKEFAEVTVLDMKSMINPKGIAEDPVLRPGDMLVVPQNTVSKMERYVRWAGVAMLGLAVLP